MKKEWFRNLLLLTALLLYSFSTIEWKEYSNSDFGFKILFPKQSPTLNTVTLDYEGKPLQLSILSVDCQKDVSSKNFVYMMHFLHYPDGFFEGFNETKYEDYFQSSIQGMLNNTHADDVRLISQKEISVPNCRAREIEFIYNNEEAIVTARFILRGNDIFTLLVTTKSRYKSNDDLHKFLNSFKLLN